MKSYLVAFGIVILLAVGAVYVFNKKHVSVSPPVTTSPISFSYPDPLPTTYLSASVWPPVVAMLDSYVCATSTPSVSHVEERVISGNTYCVSTESEGAAGSTYVTYGYLTDRGDAVFSASFTLRFPQCLNYDDPEKTACKKEQSAFDIDALAEGIITSTHF